eukprot:8841843-Alexandrium_andersonii.AAC.1
MGPCWGAPASAAGRAEPLSWVVLAWWALGNRPRKGFDLKRFRHTTPASAMSARALARRYHACAHPCRSVHQHVHKLQVPFAHSAPHMRELAASMHLFPRNRSWRHQHHRVRPRLQPREGQGALGIRPHSDS